MSNHDGGRGEARGGYLALLTLGALGVVYGDIGTSPFYAFRESLSEAYGIAVTEANDQAVRRPGGRAAVGPSHTSPPSCPATSAPQPSTSASRRTG